MIPGFLSIYRRLHSFFGPQHWWPADTSFEVMVGAILTQNTSWLNVEKAILNLKGKRLLSPKALYKADKKTIASLIKPSGYYNIKTARLRYFLDFLFQDYQGDVKKMAKDDMSGLRQRLLNVKGIGQETADSILLYALNKPIFVVDAYTKRIFSRHKIIPEDSSYAQIQDLFMRNLKPEAKIFNEYHALIVKLGKDYCLKNNPKCDICPLKKV